MMAHMTPENVFVQLGNASSLNLELMKSATDYLKAWEIQPGFYSILLQILNDYSLDNGVRWQAVIFFKNGVERYWRKIMSNRITEEEKIQIRNGLLQVFSEPISQIALQTAVLIGRIARLDVPKDWPDLLPTLVNKIQSDDLLIQHRSLLILHHTFKTMAAKRLNPARKIFNEIVEESFPFLVRIWQVHHSNFIQQATSLSSEEFVTSLEKSNLALKVIRKSLIHGIRSHAENQAVVSFLSGIHDSLKIVLEIRINRLDGGTVNLLEKYSGLHLKLLSDLVENYPFGFLIILKTNLEFICFLLFSEQGKILLFEKSVIHALNIFRKIMTCKDYKLPKSVQSASESSIKANLIKKEFFQPETVKEIFKRIITEYLLLNGDELNLWDADPEQYAASSSSDCLYTYRPCCESTFLFFFREHRDLLAPLLGELFKEVSYNTNSQMDLNRILYKDAVYNAVGIVTFDFYDEIEFDDWFKIGLSSDLQTNHPDFRILRARAIWLLGKWSGVKLDPSLRPKLYQTICPLLLNNQDLVVRLTAAESLKSVVDDFEFSCQEIEPFIKDLFRELFSLLKEVVEDDTKLIVLDVLSMIIGKTGPFIRSFCDEFIQYLPGLWESAVEHNMLRCIIVSCLISSVEGLGNTCQKYFPSFLGPVISLSTDLKQPCSVYLLEDGLELWLTVLHHTKDMTEHLFRLADNLPALLGLGSENLRTVLYIITAYILCDPNSFINSQSGKSVADGLMAQYHDLQDEAILIILETVEFALKAGPPETLQVFHSLILTSIKAFYQGTNFSTLTSLHICICSRLVLSYPDKFGRFCEILAGELGISVAEVTAGILDVWMENAQFVVEPERRKLQALAFCSLLTSGSRVVYNKIPAIFLHVGETLNDITRNDSFGAYIDTTVMCPDSGTSNTEDSEHDARKFLLSVRDSVHTVDLREYFQSQMTLLSTQMGQEMYTDLIDNIDVETKANMKTYISI